MAHGKGARRRQRERRRLQIGEERWRTYQVQGIIRRHQLDRGPAVLVYGADGRLLGQVTPERAAEAAVDGLGRIADGALVLWPGVDARVRTEPIREGAALAHIGRSMVREYAPGEPMTTGTAARAARVEAREVDADPAARQMLRRGGELGDLVVLAMVKRVVDGACPLRWVAASDEQRTRVRFQSNPVDDEEDLGGLPILPGPAPAAPRVPSVLPELPPAARPEPPSDREGWIAWYVSRRMEAWDRRKADREARTWMTRPHKPGAQRLHERALARQRKLAEARARQAAERAWERGNAAGLTGSV